MSVRSSCRLKLKVSAAAGSLARAPAACLLLSLHRADSGKSVSGLVRCGPPASKPALPGCQSFYLIQIAAEFFSCRSLSRAAALLPGVLFGAVRCLWGQHNSLITTAPWCLLDRPADTDSTVSVERKRDGWRRRKEGSNSESRWLTGAIQFEEERFEQANVFVREGGREQ